MKRVAIVGGSGFIGSHALNAFKSAGQSVLGLSRRANALGCRAVDYANMEGIAAAIKGVDSVVHVAGLAHVASNSLVDAEGAYHAANVHVAVSVAKAAILAGVSRFVLLSSAGVFGSHSPPGGFNDSMEPNPYDAYTKSKLEGERGVLEVASGRMTLVILRPPMVYGPDAPGSFHRLCTWVERGLPLPVGRIFARRSFIGIRNLCSALVAAEAAPQAGTLPMLVADREPVSVGEFAREISSVYGRRSLVLPVPRKILEIGLSLMGMREEYRRIALPFELHPSLVHSVLNWRAPYSLTEELRWARHP
jgi:UDP-N-acetyl-alpha-D-quinovosamine dehydrogenase